MSYHFMIDKYVLILIVVIIIIIIINQIHNS